MTPHEWLEVTYMYRVIIVDDEMLIRKRICLGFDWNELGYEIADDVGDGQKALSMMLTNAYDLAIVDIAMPGMNGIELVRKLREAHSSLRVIFLTGHSDFAYAKEAISYGVYSYILKPINEEEFVQTLTELRSELNREQRANRLQDTMARDQAEVRLYMEFRFFSDLLNGTATESQLLESKEKAASMGLSADLPYFLLVFRSPEMAKEDPHDLYTHYQELVGAALTIFSGQSLSLFFHLLDQCYVLFLNPDPGSCTDDPETCAGILREQASRFIAFLDSLFHTEHRCGISGFKTSFSHFAKAYQEAQSALSNVIIYGNTVIHWNDLTSAGRQPYQISAGELRTFRNHLVENEPDGCRQLLEQVFSEMAEQGCTYEDILMNVNRLILSMSDTCSLFGFEFRWIMECSGVNVAFERMNSVEEMKDWLFGLSEKIINSRTYRDEKKKDIPLVAQSCQYLQQYSNDNQLTQASVAEALGVTAAYLSALFKKSMGVSMMNYLTMLRLENARTLLLEQKELPLRVIAEQVGYSDEFYFSRSFKKYYGVSPSRIRKDTEITGPAS